MIFAYVKGIKAWIMQGKRKGADSLFRPMVSSKKASLSLLLELHTSFHFPWSVQTSWPWSHLMWESGPDMERNLRENPLIMLLSSQTLIAICLIPAPENSQEPFSPTDWSGDTQLLNSNKQLYLNADHYILQSNIWALETFFYFIKCFIG